MIKLGNKAIEKTMKILNKYGLKYDKSDLVLLELDDYSLVIKINYTVDKLLFKKRKLFYNYSNTRVTEWGIEFLYDGVVTDDDDVVKLIYQAAAILDREIKKDKDIEIIGQKCYKVKDLILNNIKIGNEQWNVKYDISKGYNWRYELANVVAEYYNCDINFIGTKTIEFKGNKINVVLARRVYMYLYDRCNILSKNVYYENKKNYGTAKGIYLECSNMFVNRLSEELNK